MEEGSGGGGGGASSPTLLSGGGRQRFEVELKPGETTIVSWKKLMKEANKGAANNNDKAPQVPAPPVPPPVAANPALDSRIAPPSGEIAANEASDAPPGSRFSAVIEKIERLYMGKNSSDEEDLNDVPDDDEYDTEDSFIDDAELNEYFQVDNSAIKHDGFFVNRGKLERTSVSQNEPAALPKEQPKKRRRKDPTKGDDGHGPNKHMKVNKKASGKATPSADKKSINTPCNIASPAVNSEEAKHQTPTIALGAVMKKPSDAKTMVDPSPAQVSNGEAIVAAKNIEKLNTGVRQSKNHGTKLKDGSPSSAVPSQRSSDKGSHGQSKSQPGRLLNKEELNQSVLPREKNVIREGSNIEAADITQQTPKNSLVARKEHSSSKSKSTMLEKAIKDLEKVVAESRPPSMEVPDADNSSQAVKRRMPPEIKQKLAKVARLAHTVHGKLSKELLNRLMSILGHLIQLRSLKRNLINMINVGLSAKEEKDARLQQIKKEIDEMVKIRVPMMKSKAIEQQAGASDDFQDPNTKDKEVVKKVFTMDADLEEKICDLYDLYVDGLDEDAGPRVRKLYAEIAELWPKGFMDNHGVKRAICRAKDRRKGLHRQKDQENLKRKKLIAPKTETLTTEGGTLAPPQPASTNNGLTLTTPVRSISNTVASNTAAQMTNSPSNTPPIDRPKQQKLKGTKNQTDARSSEALVKKKAKRKSEVDLGEGQIRQSKSKSNQVEESQKSNKPALQSSSTAPAPAAAAAVQPPQPTLT